MTDFDKTKHDDKTMYALLFDQEPGIRIHEEADSDKVSRATSSWAAQNQQPYSFSTTFDRRPWDVAAAFDRAAQRVFQTTGRGQASGGGFFSPSRPPQKIVVKVQDLVYQDLNGRTWTRMELDHRHLPWQTLLELCDQHGVPTEKHYSENMRSGYVEALLAKCEVVNTVEGSIQVPWGDIEIEADNFSGEFTLEGVMDSEKGALGHLSVTTAQRHARVVTEFFTVMEEELENRSIYKGRCMASTDDMPEFWSPFDKANVHELVLSELNEANIKGLILNPIKYHQRARSRGINKRTFLFTGTFGTGKSTAMALIAQFALKYGRTVIRCRAVMDEIEKALSLGRINNPTFLIIEDGEILLGNKSPEEISDILDHFDGVLAKNQDIIVVFTTNYEEQITQGMKRPGRIDGMFWFEALDRSGVEKLLRVKLGDALPDNGADKRPRSTLFDVPERVVDRTAITTDFDKVYEVCSKMTPAFMAEVVARTVSFTLDQEDPVVEESDLIASAAGLERQIESYEQSDTSFKEVTLDNLVTNLVASELTAHQVEDAAGRVSHITRK